MYDIKDNSSAIKELQKYLGIVERDFTILQSGIYTDKTRFAVERFQSKNSLPVTGIADKMTFDLIYAEYKRIIEDKRSQKLWKGRINFPLNIGSVGSDIRRASETIYALADYYGIHHVKNTAPAYTLEIAETVAALARIYRIPSDGKSINEALYETMIQDLRSIEEIKGYG